MESLDTTLELFSENAHWEGKTEPLSPSHVTLEQSNDDPWLNEDYFATNELTIEELFTFDLPPEKKCFTEQLLTELSQDIKDEQWLNEKMVIPSLEEYPPAPMEPIAVKKQDTQELLQEFESVYDAVELTHLTPPQTPPQTSPQRLAIGDAGQCIDQTFIYQEPILYGTVSAPASFYALAQDQQHGEKCVNNLEFSLASFPGVEEAVAAAGANMIEIAVQSPMPADIDHEMELVDELVRSRAKDLPDWTDDDNSSEFMSSPASLSPRSEASYSGSSFSHDDEWLPESRAKATTSKAAGVSGVTAGGVRKRSRPYARGTEDKKSRKKEQNKNAATRYRKKKKMEIEEVLEIERALQRDHEKLRAEATDLKREIKYLKGLMREVYKAKGLLD